MSVADPGVEWEMIVRWPWDEALQIEVRAVDLSTLEIRMNAKNSAGGATGTRRVTFADVRRALDELERSARELEKLSDG